MQAELAGGPHPDDIPLRPIRSMVKQSLGPVGLDVLIDVLRRPQSQAPKHEPRKTRIVSATFVQNYFEGSDLVVKALLHWG